MVLSELSRVSRTNMFCLNFTKLSFCQFVIINKAVWNVHKKCNVEKLEQIQHRAARMILCQRRGEQRYQDRLKTLNLTTLKMRRSSLSISLACSCLNNASLFYFCRWCTNTRQESLILSKTLRQQRSHINTAFLFISLYSGHLFHLLRDALLIFNQSTFKSRLKTYFSRVDTDVLMEVAYSCNFLAVSDSSTCPDIGTSWCHAGIIEHFEIRGFKMTP